MDNKLKPKLDIIASIEERFSFEKKIREGIEQTKAQLAHPGWVQLTAAHPTPELPKLEKQKPMENRIGKMEARISKPGLSIALPEVGNRMRKRSTRSRKEDVEGIVILMDKTKQAKAEQPTQPQTAPAQPVQAQPAEPVKSAQPAATPAKAAPITSFAQTKAPSPPKPDNVVLIGKKSPMGYVLAIMTNFNKGSSEVIIKARGAMISRAVDVEEILKGKFLPTVKVKDVKFISEEMQNKEGKMSKVSGIEIVLSK